MKFIERLMGAGPKEIEQAQARAGNAEKEIQRLQAMNAALKEKLQRKVIAYWRIGSQEHGQIFAGEVEITNEEAVKRATALIADALQDRFVTSLRQKRNLYIDLEAHIVRTVEPIEK